MNKVKFTIGILLCLGLNITYGQQYFNNNTPGITSLNTLTNELKVRTITATDSVLTLTSTKKAYLSGLDSAIIITSRTKYDSNYIALRGKYGYIGYNSTTKPYQGITWDSTKFSSQLPLKLAINQKQNIKQLFVHSDGTSSLVPNFANVIGLVDLKGYQGPTSGGGIWLLDSTRPNSYIALSSWGAGGSGMGSGFNVNLVDTLAAGQFNINGRSMGFRTMGMVDNGINPYSVLNVGFNTGFKVDASGVGNIYSKNNKIALSIQNTSTIGYMPVTTQKNINIKTNTTALRYYSSGNPIIKTFLGMDSMRIPATITGTNECGMITLNVSSPQTVSRQVPISGVLGYFTYSNGSFPNGSIVKLTPVFQSSNSNDQLNVFAEATATGFKLLAPQLANTTLSTPPSGSLSWYYIVEGY